jgi:hypothetical protein
LPRKWTFDGAVPSESGHATSEPALSSRYREHASVFSQQIHGSKRSLRSVDFTEFEQRTAYFNGDEIHTAKKGMMILDRVQVSHMAQMQNMFDLPQPRR